ncbi:MAG: invasion associated locus B family protein [Rhodobacteraceae bacterium]|nr:invasion associated locus B family protein [Paracoccaceae bacterium]
MNFTIRPLALLIALGLGGMATAQSADAPAGGAPAADTAGDPAAFSTGQEVGGVGETYTKETFGDWQLNCIRTADGSDPCQLYQLLKDDKGNPVAEVNLTALKPGGEAVAGATIIAPLETLLTQGLAITVDGGKEKKYPFTFCAAIGCISRVGFTAAEVEGFKKGAKATVTVVPVAAADQKVSANISLKGFTAGFEAISKLVAESAAP